MRRWAWLCCAALVAACGDIAPLEPLPEPDMPGGFDLSGPDAPADLPMIQCDAGQDACGLLCVDLMRDPTSCGQCGRTCVIPHAQAACQAGECAIARCEPGYFDVNQRLDDGCEARDVCTAGQPCQTSCGSMGQTACVSGQPMCQTPAEVCDAVDNDCDGQCDEGGMAGCRRGIHRGHQDGGHIFTDDMGMISNLEFANFFYLYPNEPSGISGAGFRPVFLCNKGNNKKFLTSHLECEGAGGIIKQLGFWASMPVCGAQPLYRVFSEGAQNHFYTTSAPERDNAVQSLGYRDEGVAGYIWAAP